MFWVAVPWIGIGQIWTAVAVLLIVLFVFLGRRSQKNQELLRDGIHGSAQVLEAEQTGTYINHQPQVRLRLRIQAPGVEPYELTKRVTVPMIAVGTLGSGRPLSVAIDPGDRDRIAIDWGGSPGGDVDLRSNPEARAAVLETLKEHGVDAAHGEAAANPQTPVSADADKGEPLDRLTKLLQLRAANLITDDELQEYRKRILDEA